VAAHGCTFCRRTCWRRFPSSAQPFSAPGEFVCIGNMRRSILHSGAVFGASYEDFEARITVETRGLGRASRCCMHCPVLLFPSWLRASPRRPRVCDPHFYHCRQYSRPPRMDRARSQPQKNRAETQMMPIGQLDFRHSILAIAAGLLLIGLAVLGVFRGRALIRFRTVDRRDEPIGFWVAIVVQSCMGLFALLYGVFGWHL
jgi:hypothetical protein